MSPSYSNSVLWGKRSCILSCIATLDSYRFLPFFSLEWVNNLLHKAFGTQLIILAFVAVLPVVVLYTQAMGSKEWREVSAFLCIYCSLYCCTMHLQFANYEYLWQNNAESWSLSFNSLEEQNASKTTSIQILSRVSLSVISLKKCKSWDLKCKSFQWTRIIKLLFNIRYVLSCSLL